MSPSADTLVSAIIAFLGIACVASIVHQSYRAKHPTSTIEPKPPERSD